MRGHAELPRSGGQLYVFLSVTRCAVLAKAKWGVLCQDHKSKLCDQVAELEACVVQLQHQHDLDYQVGCPCSVIAVPSRLTCKYSISEPHLCPVRCTSLLLWYYF